MEEPKKISFGFKLTKKAERHVKDEKKDYIDCVEERSIKIIGGESVEEKPDLVIPMKPNSLMTSAERLKQIAEQVESSLELDSNQKSSENDTGLTVSVKNETLDQMVVRELLEDAKKEKSSETLDLVLPVSSHVLIEGKKESSLEDYDSVPINQFGMAMLRGMGWTPGKEIAKHKAPELRPKGLGLGADKVVKQNQNKSKTATNDKDSELMLIKNAFVKVIMGKYNGYYGKVVSLDDDTGRVTVDLTVKKEVVSINECMVVPITKTEYEQQSRVINAEKYDEYKNSEKSQKSKASVSKTEKKWDHQSSSKNEQNRTAIFNRNREENSDKYKDRNYSSRRKDRNKGNGVRKDSSGSEENYKKSEKHSNDDSLSSDDTHKRKRESRKRHSSVSSFSSDSYEEKRYKKKKLKKKTSGNYEKRDIDKKRKGKKKKRDRDRSPNYKKYRK